MKATLDIEEVREAIDTSVTTTLEGMLFMEAIEAESPDIHDCDVWGRIEASSPIPCRVTFQTQRSLAGRLAEELYLSDEATCDQTLLDTVGELLNTIAGAALGAMDEEQEITMGLPATGFGQIEFVEDVVTRRYQVDDDQLHISVELRPEIKLVR